MQPGVLLLRYTQGKQWNTKEERARRGEGRRGGEGERSRDGWDVPSSSLQASRGNMSCEWREANSSLL